MAGDVLKSFLVTLGFGIDAAGKTRFDNAVAGATKNVAGLGLSIGATTAAVVTGTELIAAQMEKLFFQSRLTGAGVEGMMDYAYGASRVGVSAEQALGALQKFSLALQFDPSKPGLLAGLGIYGNNVEELFRNFIKRMGELPPQVRMAYEQMFGQDPATIEMMIRGQAEMSRATAHMAEIHRQYGLNADKAAKQAHEFQNAWGDTWARMTTLAQVAATNLEPYIKKYLLEPLDTALDYIGRIQAEQTKLSKSGKEKNFGEMDSTDQLGWFATQLLMHPLDYFAGLGERLGNTIAPVTPSMTPLEAALARGGTPVFDPVNHTVTITTTINVHGNMDEGGAREVGSQIDNNNQKLLGHLSGKGAPQ